MTRHIGYLTGRFPRPSDTFIQNEILGLRELGLTVTPYSIHRPQEIVGQRQSELHDGTTYIYEQLKSVSGWKTAAQSLAGPMGFVSTTRLAARTARAAGGVRSAAYMAEATVLAQHLKADGIDHLHNHFADSSCTVAMLAAKLAGIPYSFTIHGPGIFFEPQKWSLEAKVSNAEFVACISNFCASQLRIFSDREDWNKLEIVHCGVEIPDDSQAAASQDMNQVLFVGRLEQLKGPEDLLRAFGKAVEDAAINDAELRFIGDGPAKSQLEALARELGLADSVHFDGFASPESVRSALSESAVFCLPSYAEGVPVSLMEAMAHQVPVLTTTVGGISELVVDGESGCMVAPGDVVELTSKLVELLSSPELRDEMGRNGLKKIRSEFTSTQQAERLARLFTGNNS